MQVNEDELDAIMGRKTLNELSTNKSEKDRQEELKEMCKEFWLSSEGREIIRKAKDIGFRHPNSALPQTQE